MKKQSILILFLVLCAISASAAPIGKSKAQAVAASFFQKSSMKAKVKGATVVLSKEYASSKDAPTAFYAFSRGENVVFVSADDEMPAILGYSDRTDLDNLPPAMEYMLDYYARLTDAVRRGEIPAPKLYASPAAVEPLCKTIWNQTEPFCSLSPVMEGEKTPNGCVSTGVAQLMKYYEWPNKPTGTTETYKTGENPFDKQKTPVMDIPAVDLSTHTYNWADMIYDYTGSYTEAQGQAVAQLCYDIAVASRMNFAPAGSGTNLYRAAEALRTNFGYNKDMYLDYPEFYTEEEWVAKLKNEISQKRPLIFSGIDLRKNEGHCFVLDGYNAEGLFHVNWGWGGEGNDYFLITSLKPNIQGIGGGEDGVNFAEEQYTIFNCVPDDGTSVASEHFRFDYQYCTGITQGNGNSDDIIINSLRNLSLDEFHGDVVLQLVDKDGKVVAEKIVRSDHSLKCYDRPGMQVSLRGIDFSKLADGVYYTDVIVVSKATGTRYPARNLNEKTRILVRNGQLRGIFEYDKELLSGEILSCEYVGKDDLYIYLKVKMQVTNLDKVAFECIDDDYSGNSKYLMLFGESRRLDIEPEFSGAGQGQYKFEGDSEFARIAPGETKTAETTLQFDDLYDAEEYPQDLTLRLSLSSGGILDEKKYLMKDLMATAINDVKADKELNAPIFNTKGQRVNPNAVQGIFIRNGKKIVKK